MGVFYYLFSISVSSTLLGLQFAYIGNIWFFVLTRGEFLVIAITIKNFPTTSSLNFYIVCPTSILVLIAFDNERFAKTIFTFFSKFKEDAKVSIFCLCKYLSKRISTAIYGFLNSSKKQTKSTFLTFPTCL